MSRILITGANGFIGSTLVDTALEAGFEVTAGVRSSSDLSFLKDKEIQYLDLNYLDETKLKDSLLASGRFDYIIHNAGITKAATSQGYFNINTDNTIRFVNALRDSRLTPEKFVFISSLAACGPTSFGNIISSEGLSNPVTTYGSSKLKAEQFLETIIDFPWVVIKPTAVYGPKDKDIFIVINLIRKGFELYIGNKGQELSFIYSKDLVAAIFLALENGKIGRKYIVSDTKLYEKDALAKAVKAALNIKTFKLQVPIQIIRPVAYITEKIAKYKGVASALNIEKLNELTAESWNCDIRDTIQDLKFNPKYDLYSGIKETVEWYKENKWF